MAEELKLTKETVRLWLQVIESNKEFHYTKVLDGTVSPTLYPHLRKIIHDLKIDGLIKPTGTREGWYKVIPKVEPINYWEANENEFFNIKHPKSHVDDSEFGWGNLLNLSPADVILIGGVSNYGKTALALNYLGENLADYKCLLMGNEYTTMDDKGKYLASPKFKRRLIRMNWAHWVDEGNLTFELLPVNDNYEDYVRSGWLNIIDWINIPEQYWMIGRVVERIKARLGKGIAIIVLQKARGKELAFGADATEHFADLYFTIDPYGKFGESRIKMGKVKDPKPGQKASGRNWAFSIVDAGANLSNIREVFMCEKCWGKGYKMSGGVNHRCADCDGKGYRELDIPDDALL